MFFSYITTYKVITWYTPYQLVYGLHPLMFTNIMPVANGKQRDSTPIRVLTNMPSKLKKLQEVKMQAAKTNNIQKWNRTIWSQQENPEKQFNFGNYVLWFLKGNKSHLRKFTRKWFGPYKVEVCVAK